MVTLALVIFALMMVAWVALPGGSATTPIREQQLEPAGPGMLDTYVTAEAS